LYKFHDFLPDIFDSPKVLGQVLAVTTYFTLTPVSYDSHLQPLVIILI